MMLSSVKPNLLTVIVAIRLVAATTISIGADSALQDVRDCVVNCISDGYGGGIFDNIGCGNSNECVCQERLRPAGTSFLSSCIYTRWTTCTDADYTSAASIYNRYCSFTGPATVIASATPTQNPDINSVVTITTTSTPVYTTIIVSSTSAPITSSGEWFKLLSLVIGLALL